MTTTSIRVPVLGTQDDAFFCSPELFFRASARVGGDPLFEPPPFACPCTDGLLIIFTLRSQVRGEEVDVHGGYIRITKHEIEEEQNHPLCTHWRNASKPSDMATLLRRMGFDEVRYQYLN